MTRSSTFSCRGTFCIKRGTKYEPVGSVDAFIASIEVDSKKSWITVRCGNDVEFEGEITPTMIVQFHIPTGSVFWTAVVEDQLEMFAFKFAVDPKTKLTPEHATQTFVEKYNRWLYTALTGVIVETEDKEEVNYIASAGAAQMEREAKDEAVFGMDTTPVFSNTGAGVNTCFADSVQFNRALIFQTRGGKAVAQAHAVAGEGFGDVQEFEFAADGVQGALLQKDEQKMFFVDAKSAKLEGALREMDLMTGKIVQTYQPAKDTETFKGVQYYQKFASESPNLLSCINSTATFMIDTRLDPSNCVVVEDGKDFSDLDYRSFKKGQFFTCHATSRNGYLAVGDQSGSIRLYTGPPGARKADGKGHHAKLAKTLIEIGNPILHLDITNDGEFVIATTKDRVLVLCTLYVDDKKNDTKNGFDGRMGKHKPSPLALLPSPAQVLRLGGANAVNFAKATLEGVEGSEQWIVAVCGAMICTWSMSRVREAVKSHSVVYCETKDAQRGTLLGAEIRNDRVEFLSADAFGLQMRSKETKKKTGGFTFYSD